MLPKKKKTTTFPQNILYNMTILNLSSNTWQKQINVSVHLVGTVIVELITPPTGHPNHLIDHALQNGREDPIRNVR